MADALELPKSEAEVLEAMLPYPDALASMDADPEAVLPDRQAVAWFGTSTVSDRGLFALVTRDGVLAEYVGQHLRLWRGTRSTIVYIVGTMDDAPVPVAVSRRAFLALDLLSKLTTIVEVEVLP